ncbi:MAG: L,D-transpeptidase family protein [Inquilinus sp.]|nr:L,D-transpeptidase family protein [Inquilinus sp.]
MPRNADHRCLVLRLGLLAGLMPAAACGSLPESDLIGALETHRTVHEDTLIALARDFDVGYTELVAANPGVDPWLPAPDTMLVVPGAHVLPSAPREGLVINLAEQRLYYYGDGGVETFPIGIGREGRDTPLGATRIVGRKEGPEWYPTARARAEDPTLPARVEAGPENPLGSHALYLGWPRYLIHGTNEPYGIGRRVSSGCIRLYPEDIVRLYGMVDEDTPVHVVDEPVKIGWSDGELYLEVHPTLDQALQIEERGRFEQAPAIGIGALVLTLAGENADRIDWLAVQQALTERGGVPVPITVSPLERALALR